MQTQNIAYEQLPDDQFAVLGMNSLAYVKPKPQDNGRMRYAIHTADGNEVAVVAGRDVALATVRQNDLEPLSVH